MSIVMFKADVIMSVDWEDFNAAFTCYHNYCKYDSPKLDIKASTSRI